MPSVRWGHLKCTITFSSGNLESVSLINHSYTYSSQHLLDGACMNQGNSAGRNILSTQPKASSAENCQVLCRNLPGCRYISWNSDTQLCWMKYEATGLTPSSSVMSGPDYCDATHGHFLLLTLKHLRNIIWGSIEIAAWIEWIKWRGVYFVT